MQPNCAASCLSVMLVGVIPIAHNSGGPRADIVVDVETEAGPQRTGYLAATLEEYSQAITTVRVSNHACALPPCFHSLSR